MNTALPFHFVPARMIRAVARCLTALCLFAVVAAAVSAVRAAEVPADFNNAYQLYSKGKFAEAADLYEHILQTQGESPALLFNCGNAEFKAGHLGKAIAAYRRAELFTPRDQELRANLALVRGRVAGGAPAESYWQRWAGRLTLNEGTLLTAVFLWLACGLLAVRQMQPALAVRLRGATRLAVVLTILSGTVLAVQAASHFASAEAVVTTADATARSGPFDDAQSAFTARDGDELRVLDRHDDWVQVAGNGGAIGWLNRQQVVVLPGA